MHNKTISGIVFIITIVMFLITIIYLFFSINSNVIESHKNAWKLEFINSETDVRGYSVITLQHDGHKFIVYERGGILHHPNCPCQ